MQMVLTAELHWIRFKFWEMVHYSLRFPLQMFQECSCGKQCLIPMQSPVQMATIWQPMKQERFICFLLLKMRPHCIRQMKQTIFPQ